MSKIGIIGAGASGVIAALNISNKHEVTLIEKNDKILKKILLTGNGRCNYWNDLIDVSYYQTDDDDKLNKIIQNNKENTFKFLSSLGIYPRRKNNLYYPYSNQAFSFKTILENNLLAKNINILTNTEVKNITKKDNIFVVSTSEGKLSFDKLIISCGSKAYPKTGSNGDGYNFCNDLNIKVNNVLPALTSLKSNENYFKILNGIRCESKIDLYINDKFIKNEAGELQFTDYGVSGICIFNLSSLISKALNNKDKVKLMVNFMPNDFDIDNWFNNLDQSISKSLETFLSYKLINIILKKCNISNEAYYKSLTDKERKDLINNLTKFEIKIDDVSGFEKSQVCTGGVSLKEINTSCEVINIPGLYITGELLDVDGICGGFNLGFAFISAYAASTDINVK